MEDKEKDKFHIWCIGRSVDEDESGNAWLIEFVGVAKTRGRPQAKLQSKDVWIEHFNFGILFKPEDPSAQKLADMWQGIKPHAFYERYQPSSVDPPELAEALKIVIAHLESIFTSATVYSWR